mgnify:CR=1 FL=1
MKLTKGFGFVIDTNEYAGNFERELCAHVTGMVGECEVGIEFVDEQIETLFDNVIDVEDEGCARPCAIYPTNKRFNNGMGFHYSIGEEEQAISELIKSTEDYFNPLIEGKEKLISRLLDGEVIANWTIEACDREIKDHKEKIEKARNTTKETLGKHASYESVIIYFNSKPTDEQISLMKERAYTFNEFSNKINKDKSWKTETNIEILGFRLLEVKQTIEVTEI